ncbi:DUF6668 family protein [Micromonospora sp. WMMD710]|uniref:DUF6668 family protein n=1 Tax=Micromonospora sp. WMMD710 TaxID=3016085 RepID=UPI003242A25D
MSAADGDAGDREHSGREPRGGLSRTGVGWVAAHGGCGATTLANVLGGTDLGCRWPQPGRAEPARIFLVARTHAYGLQAASRALNAMRESRHPDGMELIGVVAVADAPGSLPRVLVSQIRLLRSVAPVHRIPWIADWRLGQHPSRLPRQVESLERRVRELGSYHPGGQ